MGSSKASVLSAWKQVNVASASLHLSGAAPAFRQAVASTDFTSLTPAWEGAGFRLYVLEQLEGQLVYFDSARGIAVVGQHLWDIMCCHYATLEQFVKDLMNGASGVKLIDYDSGPYRQAGAEFRRLYRSSTPQLDPLTELERQLSTLLERAQAIAATPQRSSEQYQALFTEVAAAGEKHQQLQARLDALAGVLELARDAVAEI